MIRRFLISLILLGVVLMPGTVAVQAQTGHVLTGVGPVDQAWAGAGTANPQDALGALYWNPAGITQLPGSSLNLSLQVLIPKGELYSTVNSNAFGPGFPQADLSGSTSSEAGPFPIPALGVVYRPAASRWALGLSAFGVGGFGVDYEGATLSGPGVNALATPQPPNGLGMGAINSEFQLLQVSPTVAYQLTDHVALGGGPTLNYSTLEVAPFPATFPDDANGDGFPSYPAASRESALGYGFQAGIHVTNLNGFHLGASFKSPQWFQDLEFEADDEAGNTRTFAFNLDYPMIVSFGVGYSGLDRWEFAADVRHIDFAHTDGFEKVGFDQTGAVQGFGWNSIWMLAAGAQYNVTERLPLRIGYSYNENPIDDELSFYNCSSPAIIQHRISGGFSYALSQKLNASFALQYGFKNSIEGNWQHPQFGALTPTTVTSELSTFFFVFGFDVGL